MNYISGKRYFLIILTIGILVFNCAGTKPKPQSREISRVENRIITIDSTLSPDLEMETFLQSYRSEVQALMSEVIGFAAVDLQRGKPEAPLNNFVADLMLKRGKKEFSRSVDAALTNEGGLRVDIPAGPITLGKIFEVMPFENELVVLELTGAQLITLAKEIGEAGGEPIAGMRLEFLDNVLERCTIRGKSAIGDSIYYLITTDYLSSTGRNRFKILSQVPKTLLGITVRDAIIDEIKELHRSGQPITAQIDGRIIFRRRSP